MIKKCKVGKADENSLSFKENTHCFVNYLAHEVLGEERAQINDFISKTVIFDRFCSALYDEMLGVRNSNELIKEIENKNLFLEPLDNDGVWYRYNSLFADVLQYELPEILKADLYMKASEWFYKHNDTPEAVKYTLKSKDSKLALQNHSNKNSHDRVSVKRIISSCLLSEREKEILECISIGQSNEEIANCLYISKNTVNWHVKNIFMKLQVNNRIKAVMTAKEMGYL
jgi:ATP/maltotriose-dependent transcriptional regulator MalT